MKTELSIYNEYLNEYLKYTEKDCLKAWCARRELVNKYAWAVPNIDAISCILKNSNIIVEMGAGTGYWAKLLSEAGARVYAYDIKPRPTWFDVKTSESKNLVNHPGAALMLCWPPYNTSMAIEALNSYTGNTLIYIGEGKGGCTGNDDFHEELQLNWSIKEVCDVPRWAGIYDDLYIYGRTD